MCFILNIGNVPPQRPVVQQPQVQQPKQAVQEEETAKQKTRFADDIKTVQKQDIAQSTVKQNIAAQKQATGQTQTTSPAPLISDAAANMMAQKLNALIDPTLRRVTAMSKAVDAENMKQAVDAIKQGKMGLTPQQQNTIAVAAQASPEAYKEATNKTSAEGLIAQIKKKFGNSKTVSQSATQVAMRIVEYMFLRGNRAITSL